VKNLPVTLSASSGGTVSSAGEAQKRWKHVLASLTEESCFVWLTTKSENKAFLRAHTFGLDPRLLDTL